MKRDARGEATGNLVLGQCRPILDARGADQVDGIALAAEGPGGGRHVVGHDPVAALAFALVDCIGHQVLGLGGKAHHQHGSPGAGLRQGGENVGVGSEVQCRRRRARLLLDLGAGRPRHFPVGDRGGADCDIEGASSKAGGQHLVGRIDVNGAHTRRVGNHNRTTHQRDLGAEARERGGDGVALLARRMVGNVANRVDRLARRAARHQRPLAGQGLFKGRPASGQYRLDGSDDFRRLRHATKAMLVARHGPIVGSDEDDTALLQRLDIGDRRGMGPHADIHGGCGEHGLVGGQQHRGGEIVGEATRHAGQDVGGGRRHDQQIGVARELDVAHLVLVGQREHVGIDAVFRQRLQRQRRHEFGTRFGEDAAHRRAALAQPADELERLEGRYAARDDQQDSLAVQHAS